jgi:superfamily II DNA helicase RecQ
MLEEQLQGYFGFESFRDGQKEVIESITKGESGRGYTFKEIRRALDEEQEE